MSWEPPEPSELHKAIILMCLTLMAFALLAMVGEMKDEINQLAESLNERTR